MPERVPAVIVEDNPQLAESIRSYFAKKDLLDVVGIAGDSLSAIELLQKVKPQLVILDLVMPQADGFVLLEYIHSAVNENKPDVIVLSALSHEAIIKRACDLGAIYYMVKPFAMDVLYDRVKDIINLRGAYAQAETPVVNNRFVSEKITSIFLSCGIPSHIKGYQYLFEAVRMVAATPDLINNITKQLYPSIGKAFNTSPMNVERSIRHAIDQAWESGKLENINDLFGVKVFARNYKPANGEFISLIANKLQLSYQ